MVKEEEIKAEKKVESEEKKKMMIIEKKRKRRYGLLLACKDSEYVKKVHGGYYNVFVKAFGEEGEEWDLFRIVDGEFPQIEDINNFDGFVVSGSPYDAYANDPWILTLCFFIQTLYTMNKTLLGVCFGHQAICRALGGKVGKACHGWDIGVTKLIMVENSFWCKYLPSDEELIPLFPSILECHQDEVWEVPVGGEVIAFSEKTRVEMVTIGDHILGIQGHPEYTKDIISELIQRLLANHSIQWDYAEDLKSKLETLEPHWKFWQKICKSFLKG
ncbi:gamma-glutamyl peptidase 3-like [Dioscorea cayenensis subsp. rotundata]|uniref:Gamma-glutamyl peptidase 3-like n=1 Tax=Dioscorea cayennensis subsp. rotundata TaxID=55577 RepID=A0AB40AXZ2_DIOCR|nr:gamma-glutamyl peptidase 3-like [Dioscorea cayenensis subsp. rotundata]